MKILVAIKRVLDYNVKPLVKIDGSGIDLSHAKMSINPFDEIALEEAIRLKEKGIAKEVIAVSCGDTPCQETLRTALAMGADRGIHVNTTAPYLEPLTVAKLLHAVFKKEAAQLILLGKQAIDDDCNQTGQMLAGLADLPQATFASKIEILEENGLHKAHVTREVDGGLETIAVSLPAVITSDLRLNQPRYISLPNILKAKQKPIETLTPEILAVDIQSRQRILNIAEPPKRAAGIQVPDVQTLVDKLRNEAKVI